MGVSLSSQHQRVAYFDSSAIVKQIVEEAESEALDEWLLMARPRLATSRVAWVEVLRTVRLTAGPDAVQPARSVLAHHDTLELMPLIADEAARLSGDLLRSLDAIHLASALRCGADVVVTYDHRLAEAAKGAGLLVEHPGVKPRR